MAGLSIVILAPAMVVGPAFVGAEPVGRMGDLLIGERGPGPIYSLLQ
jgi:hypothetical protein